MLSALVDGVGGKSPCGWAKAGMTIGMCRGRGKCLDGCGSPLVAGLRADLGLESGVYSGDVGEGGSPFRTELIMVGEISMGTCLGLRFFEVYSQVVTADDALLWDEDGWSYKCKCCDKR